MVLRILLMFVLIAGLGGFGVVVWLNSSGPAPEAVVQAPAAIQVLTAARTLRPGVLLKPDDIKPTAMPAADVPQGASVDTPAARAELLGGMLRRTVLADDVLLPQHVLHAGDRGFLAAVLGPGLRATTVGVDAITGSAGLIWPGDQVDLILTETIDDPGAPLGRRIAGETVLHNVRVIAIDQDLMQGAVAGAAPNSNGQPQSRTVTLEVTPANAERVAVATRLGHLSLSVVSADAAVPGGEAPVVKAAAVTWGGDVSAALQGGGGPRGEPAPTTLHLFEGGREGKEFHFQ